MRKSLLKTVVATAIVGAVMTVSSVVAMAAEYDDAASYVLSNDNKTATWTFKKTGSVYNLGAEDSIQGIIYVGGTVKTKNNDTFLSCNSTAELGIPVPDNSAGSITINASSWSGGRYWYVGKTDAEEKRITKTGGSVDFSADDLESGYLHITGTNNELKPNSIVVTLTTGEFDSISTIPVESVSVSPTEATVAADSSITLTATVTPSDATNSNLTWSSSDDSVATVEDGVVTGVAEGEAKITATTEDGGKTATATITVTAPVTAPVIEDYANLNASSLTAGDYLDNTIFADYFTIVDNNKSKLTVDSSSKKYGNASYTQRIKTNGAGSITKRAIQFKTSGPALVQVIGITGKTGDSTRNAVLANANGDVLAETAMLDNPTALVFQTTEGGTYYIYSTGNSIGIYSISVAVINDLTDAKYDGENGSVVVSNGKVYAIGKAAISDLASAAKASLTVNGVVVAETTDEVYNTVSISGADDITAESGSYLFGAEIENVPNDTVARALVVGLDVESAE